MPGGYPARLLPSHTWQGRPWLQQAGRCASDGAAPPGLGQEALRPVAAASAAPGHGAEVDPQEWPVCWLLSAGEGSPGAQPALRAVAEQGLAVGPSSRLCL